MLDDNKVVNCCDAPSLKTKRNLYQGHHDVEAVRQCTACRTYWFYKYSEYSGSDSDDCTVWYTRLDDGDAEMLLASVEAPDLSVLQNRASIMVDEHGVQTVSGVPAGRVYS